LSYLEEFLIADAAIEHLLDEDLLIWVFELYDQIFDTVVPPNGDEVLYLRP
jgi:hypothetical protein